MFSGSVAIQNWHIPQLPIASKLQLKMIKNKNSFRFSKYRLAHLQVIKISELQFDCLFLFSSFSGTPFIINKLAMLS